MNKDKIFEELELGANVDIGYRGGIKIYKVKEIRGKIGFKLIPVLALKDGILSAYLVNLNSAYHSGKGKKLNVIEAKTKNEEKKFRDGAKKVSKEMGLSSKKRRDFFKRIGKTYGGEIDNWETPEFKAERERLEKN